MNKSVQKTHDDRKLKASCAYSLKVKSAKFG